MKTHQRQKLKRESEQKELHLHPKGYVLVLPSEPKCREERCQQRAA